MEGAAESLDTYWTSEARSLGISYTSPDFFLFHGLDRHLVRAGLGRDRPVLLPAGPRDLPGHRVLRRPAVAVRLVRRSARADVRRRARVGPPRAAAAGRRSPNTDRSGTGASSGSVRVELQADCYAGAWVGDAATTKDANGETFFEPITRAQIADALSAASAVGDDSIQERSTRPGRPGLVHARVERAATALVPAGLPAGRDELRHPEHPGFVPVAAPVTDAEARCQLAPGLPSVVSASALVQTSALVRTSRLVGVADGVALGVGVGVASVAPAAVTTKVRKSSFVTGEVSS